jgi:L-ribulose-5-phosphate 3-epimerase UlaE
MKAINSSLYVSAVREYLTMPKDIGFDYMESIVDEIMDAESVTWTEAYEFFGSLCDRVIMEKY